MAFGIIEQPSKQGNAVTPQHPNPVATYPTHPPKLQGLYNEVKR